MQQQRKSLNDIDVKVRDLDFGPEFLAKPKEKKVIDDLSRKEIKTKLQRNVVN
jgi:hypothetical protein